MNLPVEPERFLEFLIAAKIHTYASQGGSSGLEPLLLGSHQLEYRQGKLLYRDIYFGGDFFIGQETVYDQDHPFWSMGYAGGVLREQEASITTADLYACLRKALLQVQQARPYRGPELFQEGDFTYRDKSRGLFERFWGLETIEYQDRIVYELRYHGGLIRE